MENKTMQLQPKVNVNGIRYDLCPNNSEFIPYRLVKDGQHNLVYRHRSKPNILFCYVNKKPVFLTELGPNQVRNLGL